MLPLGVAAIKCAKQMLRVPRNVLIPIILLFCIVGSFAINNSAFGVILMLIVLLAMNSFAIWLRNRYQKRW